MSSITNDPEASHLRTRSPRLLLAYVVAASIAALWRLTQGNGSVTVIGAYAIIIVFAGFSFSGRSAFRRVVADWLPLVALPILYWAIPFTTPHADGRMFDTVVQQWDRAVFGTDPARTFAGSVPLVWLSALLHAAYLSYYAIIYGPPLVLYVRGQRAAFERVVWLVTVAMIACFVAFCAFPVEGPRYAWGAPAGVPAEPARQLALYLLETGSSRGTAFPSSHVAIAVAMSLGCFRYQRRWGVVVSTVTLLMAIGAVYGGFHYVVDIVAGAFVGFVAGVIGSRGGRLNA